jgi:dihydropteroate synthase-like protein
MAAIPAVIPTTPEDPESLYRAIEIMEREGREYIADPILAPVPFGFTKSIVAYEEARRRLPGKRILMGVGNATELMDADTTGINALLFGMIAELGVTDVLAVRSSPHCRRSIVEADRARRIMHAAMTAQRLPIDIEPSLMALRDRRPYPASPEEIAEIAKDIRDANYRIETAEDGIHLYNRDGHHVAQDAFSLYPKLNVPGDDGHAFYLGVELARAEIAWKLGKRYVQDEDLSWGSAVDKKAQDLLSHKLAGTTVKKAKR